MSKVSLPPTPTALRARLGQVGGELGTDTAHSLVWLKGATCGGRLTGGGRAPAAPNGGLSPNSQALLAPFQARTHEFTASFQSPAEGFPGTACPTPSSLICGRGKEGSQWEARPGSRAVRAEQA